MKRTTVLFGIGSLILGISLFTAFPFYHSTWVFAIANKMVNQSVKTCTREPIQTRLRLWLELIPHTPIGQGALPPGVTAPTPRPPRLETHALNLELELVNTSQTQQSIHVSGWQWRQGKQTHSKVWNRQPDMSPLDRYNQVQQQLVQLKENQVVNVSMDLNINGQHCYLHVKALP